MCTNVPAATFNMNSALCTCGLMIQTVQAGAYLNSAIWFRIACVFVCLHVYCTFQFDLYRKSLIESTAEAPAVTRSRCGSDRQVRLVMWGALGVLGSDVDKLCASKPQLEWSWLTLYSNTQSPFQQNLPEIQIISANSLSFQDSFLVSYFVYCSTVAESVGVELTYMQ